MGLTIGNKIGIGKVHIGSKLSPIPIPNYAPIGLALSKNNFVENLPIGSTVGFFTTTDPDIGDSFTYSLVSGIGSDDNVSFDIDGVNLISNELFNFSIKDTYSVRVRTTDSGGLYFEETFTVNIIEFLSGSITADTLGFSADTMNVTADVSSSEYNVLVLGNSITFVYANQIVWWGFWGASASTRNTDFCHRLKAKIRAVKPTATLEGFNIAAWEVAHTTYDKSNFDKYFVTQRDLVVIRLSENVTDIANFQTSLQSLVDYIESKTSARIIITGSFWTSSTKDTILSTIASNNGFSYTELSSLDISANKETIGGVVYDEEGNPHNISDSGTAAHPNDAGMEGIASKIYAII